VEDGGWGRTEVLYEDDDRGDDYMSTNCGDGGNADSIRDAEAGTEGRASATHDPAVPCGTHTDAASGQPELFPKLLARLKGHRENRLRNESAIAAFFRAFPGPRALDSHEDGTTRAKRQKTTLEDEDDEEQAHDTDGDAVRDGSGAGGTRATLRATGDGGTTDGIKKRERRGGRSEYKAHKAGQRKRNDKYGDKAT
jgi:hypothetical protein